MKKSTKVACKHDNHDILLLHRGKPAPAHRTRWQNGEKMPTYIVKCKCQVARVEGEAATHLLGSIHSFNFNYWRCVGCSRSYKIDRLKARLSAHKCDARCTNAKGHNCECSCGGKNHASQAIAAGLESPGEYSVKNVRPVDADALGRLGLVDSGQNG